MDEQDKGMGEETREGAELDSKLTERGIPKRIRRGHFTKEFLQLCNDEGEVTKEIPWDDVEGLFFGAVDRLVKDSQLPSGLLRKAMDTLMGQEEDKSSRQKTTSDIFLCDLVVKGRQEALRFDSNYVNYRDFLGSDMAYISLHNFFSFCMRLVQYVPQAFTSSELVHFSNRRLKSLERFNNFTDFELEYVRQMEHRRGLHQISALSFPRKSWLDQIVEESESEVFENE